MKKRVEKDLFLILKKMKERKEMFLKFFNFLLLLLNHY